MIKNERGFALMEVLVAVALLGIIATVFLMALSTGSRALVVADVRATAESLARSQMEYVKSQPYAASYTPVPIPQEHIDAGFSATIDVEPLPDPDNPGSNLVGIQKITVTINHRGEEVIRLEGLKTLR